MSQSHDNAPDRDTPAPSERARAFVLRHYFALSRFPLLAVAYIAIATTLTAVSRTGAEPVLADRFVDYGAKSTAAILEGGEWWRLLTANFLHAGWLHLLLNAALMLGFGGALENIYRRSDAVLAMLAAGLATTTASALLSPGLALGGSGVTLGCLVCTATFALRHYHLMAPRQRALLLLVTAPTAVCYLALGYLVPDVDNAGHAGGALAGVISGLFLEPRLLAADARRRTLAWVPMSALLGLLALSALWPRPSLDWRALRPADDVRVEIPSTFEPAAADTHFHSFENGLGSSILVETNVIEPGALLGTDTIDVRAVADEYQDTVLARFGEAEDVRALHLGPRHTASIGGSGGSTVGAREALVLTISFDGPRGPMASWHVWVATERTLVHAVWTARALRRAQNEALFHTWLQHFSFLP